MDDYMREWPDTDCPSCGTSLRIGTPRDATVFGVDAEPDPQLESETESNSRCRSLTTRCPAGHAVYVYYGFEPSTLP